MLILMAGLPGSGKTTLCRELALQLSGTVFNKDEIRAALFSPGKIEYSTEQDDFCQKVMLDAAEYVLKKKPGEYVFLDGRTFSRRYQIEQAISLADSLQQPWKILECICPDETARTRLAAQQGEHLATNRDFKLYLRVKNDFEQVTLLKTVIDTDQSFEKCVQLALDALQV